MILTAATTAVGGFLLEKIGDLALDEGGKGLWKQIKNRAAQKELATACAVAIEAAAAEVPALAEDLRSESFGEGVVIPLVHALLESPSELINAETFAARYIEMFVERFSDTEGTDTTLVRVFQTNRAELKGAFEAFLAKLKSELYQAESWREAQHYHSTETMSAQVSRIATLLDERAASDRASKVDIPRALADAAIASAAMRAWPSAIHGMRLETPALDRLIRRVQAEPAGRTLLVGEAGTGKSALLARVAPALEDLGITVFAIKADQLPASLESLDDLARALGVDEGLEDRITAIAGERPVALLLDQLDAVSDVMDLHSHRMQLLLQLVHRMGARDRAGDTPLPIHVVVSSRPFEAAHDARFQQLKAEALRLDLLGEDQVEAMLAHLRVPVETIDVGLRQTLRRPFALKLYADIVSRMGEAVELTPAGLLEAWLATAKLGVGQERQETSNFLLTLAAEMVASETLWRPLDTYELTHAAALRRAEAVGLVVRSGDKIGFSHQSWLDDFQAKTFRTGRDLAEYAWARQDSLFIRASILRSLERLRVRDSRGYEAALGALLGETKTRRHILHLVADIIATVLDPLPFEIAWVEHWIHNDTPLAARALRQITPRWDKWREGMRRELPTLMITSAFHWQAAQLLAAEVQFDADHVAGLIDRHWNEPARDHLVFEILKMADFVGLEVQNRLGTIFNRTQIEDHSISQMVRTLRANKRFDDAASVVAIWLEAQSVSISDEPNIYELEALADAAPSELAGALVPWFVKIASRDITPYLTVAAQYPRSQSLPNSWGHHRETGSPLDALQRAIKLMGEKHPKAMWALLKPYASVEIDQVHELIAVGLTAAGALLAREAFDYLLTDPRRFQISHVIVAQDGVIDSVYGWHSQQLICAIAPGLDDGHLATLRDSIEAWSCYKEQQVATDDPELAARRVRWCDEARFPLLEALPPRLLSPERRTAIFEWRHAHPRLDPDTDNDGMAGWVGSPVTHEEMADLSDDELVQQLDEFHDRSGEHRWSRPISRSGGVRELARAFGAFGKANPDRAIELAARLSSDRHQQAAGELVRQLAEEDAIDRCIVLDLILDLDRRGFTSADWRQDASNALQKLAIGLKGLDYAVVALLEGWIETDPTAISAQIERRVEFEGNSSRTHDARERCAPLLFGSTLGMQVLPNHNFTILSAISNALLCREKPDYDAWASTLERHLDHTEDPAIWTAILLLRGDYLLWADAEQASRIFDRLWAAYPEAWRDIRLIRFWWRMRKRISNTVLIGTMVWWIGGPGDPERQAAAELLTACHLVDPENVRYRLLFDRLDRTVPAIAAGVLLSASAAWRENDPIIRFGAHDMLMASLPMAVGKAASAIARAVNRQSSFVRDARTKEFLLAMIGNDAVFRAALDNRFAEALQDLLLYPGFDDVVLAIVEKAADMVTNDGGPGWGVGEHLVRVAIALQRSSGPTRSRAMDVYERLLDAAIYGAEEAAKASLAR